MLLNKSSMIPSVSYSVLIVRNATLFHSHLLLDTSPEIYFRLHLRECRLVIGIGWDVAAVPGYFLGLVVYPKCGLMGFLTDNLI